MADSSQDNKRLRSKVKRLIRRMDAGDVHTTFEKILQLQDQYPETMDTVAGLLRTETPKNATTFRTMIIVGMGEFVALPLMESTSAAWKAVGNAVFATSAFLVLVIVFLMGARIELKWGAKAAMLLALYDDEKYLGTLIRALWLDKTTYSVAANALIYQLCRATDQTLVLLDAEERTCLLRVLKERNPIREAPFITAVLETFIRLEETSALPQVQRLANDHNRK